MVLALSLPATLAGAEPKPTANPMNSIIKHFDFDERRLGNHEDTPMLWKRHQAEGFPAYASGKFDTKVGFNDVPSFYMQLDGRSCAYHYVGLNIPVEANSDYQVVCRIKPDQLEQARAYVSAFLYDANGNRLPRTERFSRMVGGNRQAAEWEEVTIQIPSNTNAISLGLTMWVTQPSIWWSGERPVKHIERKDVNGGAWFDDLVVYRLPSIELSTSAEERGHVYDVNENPTLLLKLGYADMNRHQAILTVRDADGTVIKNQTISNSESPLTQISLDSIGPGLYRIQLRVQIDQGASIERQLSLLKLGGELKRLPELHRFGLLLDDSPAPDWKVVDHVIGELRIYHIKIPVDNAMSNDAENIDSKQEEFLRTQIEHHRQLSAILVSGPGGSDSPASRETTLIDLFSMPAEAWRPFLTNTVARFESVFQQWQIGADGAFEVYQDPRLGTVLNDVRQEMTKLTTMPILVSPWSVHHELPSSPIPANFLSMTVPSQIQPAEIPQYIDSHGKQKTHEQLWAVIESLPSGRYHRLPQLADFTKRLIFAHQSRASRIYIHQPWVQQSLAGKMMLEPTELLGVYRTIVNQLDDATYLGELDVHSSVSCHAYERGGRTVLVMWDDQAPLSGRKYELQVSGAQRVTNIWGEEKNLENAGNKAVVDLTPLPIFVHEAETWLVQFRQGLKFHPTLLSSELTSHDQDILITNPQTEPISGNLKLEGPEGWQIRPSHIDFALQPGETARKSVRIQAAPREPAGLKQIQAKVTLDASALQQFEVELPLRLDLADMDVWADMVVEDNNLIVRHGVTNRSEEGVTFVSYVDAPGRKRQNLYIVGLQPNQTVIKKHLLVNSPELSEQTIRVGLKQKKSVRTRVHDLSLMAP